MAFNWKDYQNQAETLRTEAQRAPARNEDRLRSSISRAYYGIFCYIRDHFSNELKRRFTISEIESPKIHSIVRDHLKTFNNIEWDDIESDLDELRKLRNKADYITNITIDLKSADFCIQKMKKISKEFEKLTKKNP